MTREEEEARLTEIEACPHTSDKIKADMRAYLERQWGLADLGIIDMWKWKADRMVVKAKKLME